MYSPFDFSVFLKKLFSFFRLLVSDYMNFFRQIITSKRSKTGDVGAEKIYIKSEPQAFL
jgi:hypothetical protein